MIDVSVIDKGPNVLASRTLLETLWTLCTVDHCPLSITALAIFIRAAATSCKKS